MIDGSSFHDPEGFYDEVERSLLKGAKWGRNLDALNDIFYGDFGPLPSHFEVVWRYSAESRRVLDHVATAAELRSRLERARPDARPHLEARLRAAERGAGPTLFDDMIEIIASHENVALRLE